MVRQKLYLLSVIALVAVALGCGGDASNPISPSGAAAGSLTAASDGSTLKVTAPVAQSPSGGALVATVRPQFIIENASGKYASATFGYRVQIMNAQGGVVYEAGPLAQGDGRTAHTVTKDLPDDQTLEWHARAELDDTFGPWSNTATFKTPPLVVIDPPAAVSPASGLTTAIQVELVVNNGQVQGPAGTVRYQFEVSDEQTFATVLKSATVERSSGTQTKVTISDLPYDTELFWRANASNGIITSPWTPAQRFRTGKKPTTPSPTTPAGPTGAQRSISVQEALSIIIDVHNRTGANLGAGSTRESRVVFWWSAVAAVHYGHPEFNPAGGDSGWCVKDGGSGRPPSDDVLVRCDSRESWDCVGGAGAPGYRFHLDYIGRLPGDQNVYPPPLSSLPR